jgi:hypothetical protein
METPKAGKPRVRFPRLVREHPAVSLVVATGVAALAGLEVAAGALLGIGAALLLAPRSGAEARADLARRAREVMSALRRRPTPSE